MVTWSLVLGNCVQIIRSPKAPSRVPVLLDSKYAEVHRPI